MHLPEAANGPPEPLVDAKAVANYLAVPVTWVLQETRANRLPFSADTGSRGSRRTAFSGTHLGRLFVRLVVRVVVWTNGIDSIPRPGVSPMSIVVRFSPKSMTAEQYDKTIRILEERGGFPPDGQDYHVCFGSDGNLRVSEIWDSQEQFEAFGERLMPILAEVGIQFSGPPETFEVHNIIRKR
jgi:hypothetical protein